MDVAVGAGVGAGVAMGKGVLAVVAPEFWQFSTGSSPRARADGEAASVRALLV